MTLFPFWHYEKSTNLYYEKIEGPDRDTAIVFVHGLGGTHTYWPQDYEKLQKYFSLYFIDLLGFGYSAKPKGDYPLEKHISAIHEFIQQRVPEKNVVLVGHSLGALIALAYTTKHTNNIHAAYLLGLPYFHSQEEARRALQHSGSLFHFFFIDTLIAKILCRLMCAFRPIAMKLAPCMMNPPKPLVRDAFLHTYDSYFSTLQHVLFEQNVPSLLTDDVWKKIFLMHGENDRTAPIQNIKELAHSYNLKLIVLPGQGHNFPRTSPDKVMHIIEKNTP